MAIDFSDPRYHAAPSAAAMTAEQKAEADALYRQAQLDALRQQYGRTEKTPLPQAPKTPSQQATEAYQQRRAGVLGESAAKVEFGLPKLETLAKRAISEGSALVKHPGFTAAVGMPNPFKGGFGVGNIGPAGDFVNALKGVKSKAFMNAYEALKGAGAIGEKEGAAATAALANMETATTENEFKRQLQSFLDVVADGVKVARQQARMGASPFTYDQLMLEKQRRAAGKK